MRRVALAVAPADAAFDAQEAAGWIMRSKGGEGVLRELIERLMRSKHRWEEHLR
jgi:3-deoxy-D-manno-octulosonate 8-phosphate phosphatase (KDO 8-P phosphatase)